MTAFIALLCAALLVVVDQLTKYLVVSNLAVGDSVSIIDGILRFTYVRNDGAVFGSLSGKGYIFNTATILIVVIGIALIIMKKLKPRVLLWAATLVIAGGIGNLIDRFRLKYVIDFIDVYCFGEYWKWVFNFADCCVVIGCCLMILYCVMDIINDYKSKAVAVVKEENEDASVDAQK